MQKAPPYVFTDAGGVNVYSEYEWRLGNFLIVSPSEQAFHSRERKLHIQYSYLL